MKEVDWSKAPEGATHYNAACPHPWLKDAPVSFYYDGWIEYSSNGIAMEDLRNAVKRPEWGGTGIPPVGINNADYVVQKFETTNVDGKQKKKLIWICPFYRAWKAMLNRCYSAKFQDQRPTYIGCTVSDEWLTFSNFRSWMMTQDWEGNQLDKDLLIKGNKVYSPETCVFVSGMVNTFTTDCGAARGEWLIGVYWDKQTEKFRAQCGNPFTKKQEKLGRFDSEEEAHQAWLKRKLELAYELAAEQTDSRVAEALIDCYSNYKTPEQIAKEERLDAIDEMLDLARCYSSFKELMSALYDAGYRKTEDSK